MKYLNLILIILFNIIVLIQLSASLSTPCVSDDDCNNGACKNKTCACFSGYITFKQNQTCEYKQKNKLVSFLLSFFVGGIGVDWFYLAEGNGGYIAAGVFKLLTGGGFGIWWFVDWVRVLANAFKDGNGAPLQNW